MTKDTSSADDGIKTPISDPTEIQQPMSPYTHEPTPSQNAMELSQTQRFSQGLSQLPTSGYEVPDEERQGVWGYLIPVGMAGKYSPLVLKNRSACTPDKCDHLDKPVPKDNQVSQGKTSDKKGTTPSRGYLIGRHPECGKCLASFQAITNQKTLSSTLLQSRTVTASYSLRTRTAKRLPCSKILLATGHLSTMPS
jgi:serine/threonine-protein kinase CHEK2